MQLAKSFVAQRITDCLRRRTQAHQQITQRWIHFLCLLLKLFAIAIHQCRRDINLPQRLTRLPTREVSKSIIRSECLTVRPGVNGASYCRCFRNDEKVSDKSVSKHS